MENNLKKIYDMNKFMFAGNATFTLLNRETQGRFTYKIRKLKQEGTQDKDIFFVKVLTGQDNENSYKFIGTIFVPTFNGNKPGEQSYFKWSYKGGIGMDAQSVKVFNWFFENVIIKGHGYPVLEFYHAGKCCRCGRTLTVPESIESGIGPECEKLMSKI